jgi:hypothetical protein
MTEAADIFYEALYPRPVLQTLAEEDFITIEHQPVDPSDPWSVLGPQEIIRCTTLGSVTIRSYVFPQTAKQLESFLATHEPATIPELLVLAKSLINCEERRVSDHYGTILRLRIEEHSTKAIFAAVSRHAHDGAPVYYADIQTTIDETARMLRFISDYAQAFDRFALEQLSSNLQVRVKLGIREDLVPLGHALRSIPGEILRHLSQSGYGSIESLAGVSLDLLTARTRLPTSVAYEILGQVQQQAHSGGVAHLSA